MTEAQAENMIENILELTAVDQEVVAANARLTVAAPALLHSLRWIVDAAATEPGMDIYKAHMEQARAAIAKATGK